MNERAAACLSVRGVPRAWAVLMNVDMTLRYLPEGPRPCTHAVHVRSKLVSHNGDTPVSMLAWKLPVGLVIGDPKDENSSVLCLECMSGHIKAGMTALDAANKQRDNQKGWHKP